MKWGLVGTGPWAYKTHAPSLAAHQDAEFTAVWGRDPRKAAQLAAEYGVEAVTSFEDLLGRVDAISFAIAPGAQASLARQAMARGHAVLLEKPLSTDPAEVRRFADDLHEDARALVFLTRLFEPVRGEWLRESIGQGYTSAHAEWISSALSAGSVYADSAWRHGAGIVWDLLPHVLSQLEPVLGEVVDASAEPWQEFAGLMITLRHAGGSQSLVRMTLSAQPEQREEWIRFDGPGGSSTSPRVDLDFVGAHGRAISALGSGAVFRDDPLLRGAEVEAAIRPTEIMGALVGAIEGA